VPDTDRVLIDPTPQALESALADAAARANGRARLNLLTWPPADLSDFLSAWGAAEGYWQWTGGTLRGSGQPRTIVAAAWWTDPLGRKHTRLVARRGEFNHPTCEHLLARRRHRPFQWLTYPENLYFRQTGGKEELWGVCRCGAVGPPSDLGWMGNLCGPCHDRDEAGALPRFPGPTAAVLSGRSTVPGRIRFTPDGRGLVATGQLNNEVTAWDLESGSCRKWSAPGGSLQGGGVLPDGRVVGVPWNGRIVAWRPAEGLTEHLFHVRDNVHGGTVSSDGTVLAVVDSRQVTLWDLKTRREGRATSVLRVPGFPTSPVLEFAPDGRILVCETQGPALCLLETATGWPCCPDLPLSRRLQTAAFSPDGSLLAAVDGSFGRFSGLLRLWSVHSGKAIPLPLPDLDVRAVAFSPDGRLLATTYHGAITLWDAATLRQRVTFAWHADWINAVAFSPDGRWLATGAEDHLVKLWPVATMLGG